jgi:hypothetical protein
MQGFEQVEIRNGDRLYTSRNVGFTPLHIKELISLVEFAESSESFAVKKQKQQGTPSARPGESVGGLRINVKRFDN